MVDYPSGCFLNTGTNTVSLNTHATGAANAMALPLCAGAPYSPLVAALRRLRGVRM